VRLRFVCAIEEISEVWSNVDGTTGVKYNEEVIGSDLAERHIKIRFHSKKHCKRMALPYSSVTCAVGLKVGKI
jgi:hypothetical protein